MAHQTRPSGEQDLGTGTNGWGNESQSYTNVADNVIVSGGNLKNNAKKSGEQVIISGKT
jgi:hypothetical protein